MQPFGQIQNDLSILLDVGKDDIFPWAVKLDDLEVFLLTLKAMKKSPMTFVNYLLMREELHGQVASADELQICGGFLTGAITSSSIKADELLITHPDLASLFDVQYRKGLGFKNEKMIAEKQNGNYMFL